MVTQCKCETQISTPKIVANFFGVSFCGEQIEEAKTMMISTCLSNISESHWMCRQIANQHWVSISDYLPKNSTVSSVTLTQNTFQHFSPICNAFNAPPPKTKRTIPIGKYSGTNDIMLAARCDFFCFYSANGFLIVCAFAIRIGFLQWHNQFIIESNRFWRNIVHAANCSDAIYIVLVCDFFAFSICKQCQMERAHQHLFQIR